MRKTALERWKVLARVENERARRLWGPSGHYHKSERFEDLEITSARRRRDDRIEAWHAAGISVREISRRVGLAERTVAHILQFRRLAARED